MHKLWKSVKTSQSYREFKGGNFFETQCSNGLQCIMSRCYSNYVNLSQQKRQRSYIWIFMMFVTTTSSISTANQRSCCHNGCHNSCCNDRSNDHTEYENFRRNLADLKQHDKLRKSLHRFHHQTKQRQPVLWRLQLLLQNNITHLSAITPYSMRQTGLPLCNFPKIPGISMTSKYFSRTFL